MSSGQRKTLQRGGSYARYLPSGHVAYMHEGALFAVPFDLKRLEVTGQPTPILEGVVASPGVGGRRSHLPIPETSCISQVALEVKTSPSTGWTTRKIHAPPGDSRRLPQSRVLP